MQDDQPSGSDDSSAKDVANSNDVPGELTLAGGSSASGDTAAAQSQDSANSIPDPAQEALEAKQTEEPAPTNPAPQAEPAADPVASPAPQSDDALDPIKKEALQKLEPLVGELDLNPEEKYRALMMIIQATDNKDLVNEAYQAAEKIEDDKTRAQALLSIINEIDYFKNKEKV